jgi:hypothetical protein
MQKVLDAKDDRGQRDQDTAQHFQRALLWPRATRLAPWPRGSSRPRRGPADRGDDVGLREAVAKSRAAASFSGVIVTSL